MSSRRVAILGEPTGWHATRLAATLTARGHTVGVVPWQHLAAAVAGTAGGGETVGPAM